MNSNKLDLVKVNPVRIVIFGLATYFFVFANVIDAKVRIWVADPFRPKLDVISPQQNMSRQVILPSETSIVVQGIMKMGSSYNAMISNKFVREGDSIGGFIVKSIGKDKIIVQGSSGELRQVLFN
ncbi:hypothetical protein HOG98_09920 [bacterium]|nr:hypothetical protein [bacterium]